MADWGSLQRLDHGISFAPQGYPELGLQPVTITLKYRANANVETARRRVVAWEEERGNPGLRLENLEYLPKELAFELLNVYAALRERFPHVCPSHIDFSESRPEDDPARNTLAYALVYPSIFPFARFGADELPWAPLGPWDYRFMDQEGISDPTSSGSIRIGSVFSDLDDYLDLEVFWALRNQSAIRRGRPDRVRHLDLAVSSASYIFVHEFGHLLEGEILTGGVEALEPHLASLSEIVFGSKPESPRHYRQHLINYPAADRSVDGPAAGSTARRNETKRTLKVAIGEALGCYAAHSRDELFAESFAVAVCSTSPNRHRLRPFLAALRSSGHMRRRPPRRL